MTTFLNPLDSAFILLEVPGSAMNIGAVIELDFGDVADPGERFAMIRKNIGDRLHEIPVLTKRIVRAPFDLTWPVLVPEEHFDLDRHVLRVALPEPGTPDQFDAMVSEFLSRPLPANRSLWQMLVIEGLEDGRAALALKVHHALADGVSGAETFAGLFDISPEVRPPAARTVDAGESSVTSSLGLVWQGLDRIRRRPQLAVENVRSWARRLCEVLRALARVFMVRGRKSATPGQPTIFEAKRTSLNGAPGIDKEYHRLRVSLAAVKRAAKAREASVTDFVIATVGGALRRLLDDRGEVPAKDLIAFVPINVRGEGAAAALGNQISGMLVALHTDVADPEQRIRAIANDSAKTVGVQRESRARLFQDVPRVLGPWTLSLGGKLISTFGLFDRMPPMANLMVSSVPGPAIPLWLSGHRVASAAPVGPLFGTFSLNITALSLGENLEFGLLGCAATMPDLSTLRDYLLEEANALFDTPAT